jgi:hypothetical protein
LIFANWNKAAYAEMAALIRKGLITEDGYKKFPPKAARGGVGQRGAFQKFEGGWQLA